MALACETMRSNGRAEIVGPVQFAAAAVRQRLEHQRRAERDVQAAGIEHVHGGVAVVGGAHHVDGDVLIVHLPAHRRACEPRRGRPCTRPGVHGRATAHAAARKHRAQCLGHDDHRLAALAQRAEMRGGRFDGADRHLRPESLDGFRDASSRFRAALPRRRCAAAGRRRGGPATCGCGRRARGGRD